MAAGEIIIMLHEKLKKLLLRSRADINVQLFVDNVYVHFFQFGKIWRAHFWHENKV